jgi:hypothetical protein
MPPTDLRPEALAPHQRLALGPVADPTDLPALGPALASPEQGSWSILERDCRFLEPERWSVQALTSVPGRAPVLGMWSNESVGWGF